MESASSTIRAAEERMNAEIGHRIWYQRIAGRVSLTELADMLGCSIEHVESIENGSARTTAVEVLQIAAALEIPMLWLMAGVTWDAEDTAQRRRWASAN